MRASHALTHALLRANTHSRPQVKVSADGKVVLVVADQMEFNLSGGSKVSRHGQGPPPAHGQLGQQQTAPWSSQATRHPDHNSQSSLYAIPLSYSCLHTIGNG